MLLPGRAGVLEGAVSITVTPGFYGIHPIFAAQLICNSFASWFFQLRRNCHKVQFSFRLLRRTTAGAFFLYNITTR